MITINPKKMTPVQQPGPIAVDSTEAARLLSISPRTLHQLTKDGKIHVKKIGRKLLYPVSELERFVNEK